MTTAPASSSSSSPDAGARPALGRPQSGSRFAVAAAVALAVKIPLVVVGVTNPDGIAGAVPPTEIGVGLVLSLAFLASSIVFLLLRRWFGAASAIAYALYTLVGGVVLLAGGYPLWGALVAATSGAALALTTVAVLRGAFRADAAG